MTKNFATGVFMLAASFGSMAAEIQINVGKVAVPTGWYVQKYDEGSLVLSPTPPPKSDAVVMLLSCSAKGEIPKCDPTCTSEALRRNLFSNETPIESAKAGGIKVFRAVGVPGPAERSSKRATKWAMCGGFGIVNIIAMSNISQAHADATLDQVASAVTISKR